MTDMQAHVTAAALVTFVLGLLKRSPWFPWLTAESSKVNRIAAVALSGMAALGLHFSYNHDAGQLLITGVTLSGILSGLWQWAGQFALTHGWFKATSTSGEILALLRAVLAGPAQSAGKQ